MQRLTAATNLRIFMKKRFEIAYYRLCAVWACLTAGKWCVSVVRKKHLEAFGTLKVSEITSCLLVAILRKNFGEAEQDARVEMFKAILSAKRIEMKVWGEDGTIKQLNAD